MLESLDLPLQCEDQGRHLSLELGYVPADLPQVLYIRVYEGLRVCLLEKEVVLLVPKNRLARVSIYYYLI